MLKKKLLITGSGSFLMTNFIRKAIYEHAPYEIVSIDKCVKSNVLNNLYSHKNHRFLIGDVADEHFVDTVFNIEKPNIVLHDAFLKESNKESFKTNIYGTQVLINASLKYNIENFVFVSTNQVCGSGITATEDSNYNPLNSFAAHKAASEILIRTAKVESDLKYTICRLSSIYGPRQRTGLIPSVVRSLLNNQNISLYSKGTEIREYTHVFDICSALLLILSQNPNNEIYNISSNLDFTNSEVAKKICSLMEKNENLLKTDDTIRKDFSYRCNSEKLKEIGWEPSFKLNQGLQNTLQWYIANSWFLRQ